MARPRSRTFARTTRNKVRLDAQYRVAVNGMNADVQIENAQVKTGSSLITAQGTVAGSPTKRVAVSFATQGAEVQDLRMVVDKSRPQMAGKVNFDAKAEFSRRAAAIPAASAVEGRCGGGGAAVHRREEAGEHGRVQRAGQKNPPGETQARRIRRAATLAAKSVTRFDHGMAFFPDIHADLPGADAHLHGTFNLLDTKVHLEGRIALQRGISHATTGWKAALLKPLTPFFKKKNAGAVVPIQVTGTAAKPKVGADIF